MTNHLKWLFLEDTQTATPLSTSSLETDAPIAAPLATSSLGTGIDTLTTTPLATSSLRTGKLIIIRSLEILICLFCIDTLTTTPLATSSLRTGELSDDNYRELLSKVSSWFKESEKVNLLKVILCKCEQFSVVEIERSNDPFELFKLLEGPGIISQSNIDVLIEIIAIGGIEGVYESIKHLIPTFAGFEKLIISERWNDVRKVIRFGLKISNADKVKIGQLRGLKVKEWDDVWILIFKLVMKDTFTKKSTEFVRLLKDNDMDSLATLLE
ncbi:uncharacterized protein [Antedon mediterranea]|uniref:uncharacterized protein n=1 Tax=Antedon mediterranea TaxID=105859 RepID=UPI003AF4CD32